MKFTYIPVPNEDGSWKMVAKLDENQRRLAEKARRRFLNIKKEDNPWWTVPLWSITDKSTSAIAGGSTGVPISADTRTTLSHHG